jgi:hypothetical protein
MPGKRPVNKGSFGGHLDDLVKQFTSERRSSKSDGDDGSKTTSGEPPNVNQLLFKRTPH